MSHKCIRKLCIEFFYSGDECLAALHPEDFKDSIPEYSFALVMTCVCFNKCINFKADSKSRLGTALTSTRTMDILKLAMANNSTEGTTRPSLMGFKPLFRKPRKTLITRRRCRKILQTGPLLECERQNFYFDYVLTVFR